MIDVRTAEQLLDFGARIGPGQRADEQLRGAVAIHNILSQHRVAYLADEVGMGKTYVALGAVALFRHFNPRFRLLVIAPRQNIQLKWMKEFRLFVTNNVRFPDMRMKGVDSQPAHQLVFCDNLSALARETSLNQNRDFFVRLTSFSLPIGGKDVVEREDAHRLRDELRAHLPGLPSEIFYLRDKKTFKDNVARALCCILPEFDLVIVDEGHNLKHGFGEKVSARNRVVALAFGHPRGVGDRHLFRHHGPRAKRVLFLSATPVEETYRHLWNQLDVFGRGSNYEDLKADDVSEERKKEVAARFLIRRVTAMRVNGQELTKNLYRREWRRGGVEHHDDPMRVTDDRQRLIVSLVQKKVSELLGSQRFKNSFQIGMLASFESFLETAKLKRTEDERNFDDREQTEDVKDELEREGADVLDLNRLARSYRNSFGGEELPHPKMDAVKSRLANAWKTGEKSLVFVRRVASVKELKRKLDEEYDKSLLARLRLELPKNVLHRFEQIVQRYLKERMIVRDRDRDDQLAGRSSSGSVDRGGTDTFFAWFFRGDGPSRVVSGANIQRRFTQRGTTYATFFEDNYVAAVLNCDPGDVEKRFGEILKIDTSALREQLRLKSRRFLGRAKKIARADHFESVQAAAIEWLKDINSPCQEFASIVWEERFENSVRLSNPDEAPDIGDWLQCRTFFTELRKRTELRARLWPEPQRGSPRDRFRERELRAQLLAAASRLGHAFIDLYVLTIERLKSLKLRSQEAGDDESTSTDVQRIGHYLTVLERQMSTPISDRGFRAFDELSEIAKYFDLILDVNEPEARGLPLKAMARRFGDLFGSQQPTGGMSGQLNQTLVRQFRMPGYPLVLVSTELLQEGEDLHTFCSSVQHYGISWTPSSMEQRIGRIDRVRSQTERRLSDLNREPLPGELLQVYFPHLEDTIEVVQVQRVLERMNTFLRLMHEGLTLSGQDDRKLNLSRELSIGPRSVPQIRERLKTAFPECKHLHGTARTLAATEEYTRSCLNRFRRLSEVSLPAVDVRWEKTTKPWRRFGVITVREREHPFRLTLSSFEGWLCLRCVSPLCQVSEEDDKEAVEDSLRKHAGRVGAIQSVDDFTFDLTVEDDVLLPRDPSNDVIRLASLLNRVAETADRLAQLQVPGRDLVRSRLKAESGTD
jgi:Type III restriction enzyme, res subunit/Helicase conserved C-terminal domain